MNNIQNSVIKYAYRNPGDFQIKVNISNALSYFTFTQLIRIMSRVDDLIPGLVQTPITYFSGTGLADFTFIYAGTSKAGSHALITFWPGDSANSSYGPFQLGMDFDANINRVSLSYEYAMPGNYVCSFLVANPLGSKWFTVSVDVLPGILGFYIDVNPKNAKPNDLVTISAYMIQGHGVKFSFFERGNLLGTNPRSCTIFLLSLF